jgi:hypothetical protein
LSGAKGGKVSGQIGSDKKPGSEVKGKDSESGDSLKLLEDYRLVGEAYIHGLKQEYGEGDERKQQFWFKLW